MASFAQSHLYGHTFKNELKYDIYMLTIDPQYGRDR